MGTKGKRAEAPAPALLAREEQASERRRQLVRIASDLIEEGGADHVTLPRVTDRAGCARTLVYRYFASREELLVGVLEDYFERLDARIPEAEQRAAVTAFLAATGGRQLAAGRELIALFWDVQAAAGLGGAILRTTPLPSPSVRAIVEASRVRHERRITDPLRAAGLSEAESRVAVDTMIASFVGLALRWRAGEIGRAQAIDVHVRATIGVIRGLLPARGAAGAATGRRPRAAGPARRPG